MVCFSPVGYKTYLLKIVFPKTFKNFTSYTIYPSGTETIPRLILYNQYVLNNNSCYREQFPKVELLARQMSSFLL